RRFEIGHPVPPLRISASVAGLMFPPDAIQTILPVPASPFRAAAVANAAAPGPVDKRRLIGDIGRLARLERSVEGGTSRGLRDDDARLGSERLDRARDADGEPTAAV